MSTDWRIDSPYTFSAPVPRLRIAALPPHVFALFTCLAKDRDATVEAKLAEVATRRWGTRAERRERTEETAQELLGVRNLGMYLEGSLAAERNDLRGWVEMPRQIMWAHRYEHDQTFRTASGFRMTLTRAQVRNVRGASERARELLRLHHGVSSRGHSTAALHLRVDLLEFDKWLRAKDRRPQGRRALFTPEWWEAARWTYERHGKRFPVVKIARQSDREDPNYVSRKIGDFLDGGRLTALRRTTGIST